MRDVKARSMKCDFSDKCRFCEENISMTPLTVGVYKRIYCDLDFVKCARYMVAAELGYELVPDDLYPTHNVRALKIIAENNQATADKKPMPDKEIAMLLLNRFNGDHVVALGELYAEVRRKYPGYVCSVGAEPDDEFYHAHLEYISIRNHILSLVKEEIS